MFNKKFSSNIRLKRRMITSSIILLVVCLGIGYSAFTTDLSINGILNVSKYDQTLYGVLEKAAKKGTCAREYTGEHHDSFTEESTKKIYHWYAPLDTAGDILANEILDKNNVIFGGFCWQMIRTTDAGGVKMIYNGVPSNGQCNDTDTNVIGTSKYNLNENSLAYIGYMYNTTYTNYEKEELFEDVYSRVYYSYKLYYSDSYIYNSVSNTYQLDNPIQMSSSTDYSSIVGKYSMLSTTPDTSGNSVQYVVAAENHNFYYISLLNNNPLSDYLDTYTYGTSYTDNGNGTYTINNPTTIARLDFQTLGKNISSKYICKNAVNNTCSDLWHSTNRGDSVPYSVIHCIKSSNTYKFSNSFSYTNGHYVLNGDSVTVWDTLDSEELSKLSTHHYTCFNLSGECEQIAYVFEGYGALQYIELSNGKSVDDAINEMLYNDNVNTNNSTIKTYIDNWYHDNLIAYENYIEDSIYCNNRSQSNQTTNGWYYNGGSVRESISFVSSSPISINCTNETDRFSVSNNKAKLIYPIGMPTYEEMSMLGNSHIYRINKEYWLNSPDESSTTFVFMRYVDQLGQTGVSTTPPQELGVRPVISLKPGTEYKTGNGSKDNPYYVGEMYNINSSSNLVPKQSPPEYTVTLGNDDYAVTSFKLDGTLVNGDSFTMPHNDVTITDVQSIAAYYTITNTDSTINVPDKGRYNRTIELTSDNYRVDSFKLNGILVTGNSFIMPAQNVTITDIQKTPIVIVESEHSPYANNIDNVTYYENTFAGATSLTVELTYQTEGTSWDWIYLYDNVNSTTPFNSKKYGGSTLKTETLTIPSNYLKIVFRTDSSGNNFYGFKAIIAPNYS